MRQPPRGMQESLHGWEKQAQGVAGTTREGQLCTSEPHQLSGPEGRACSFPRTRPLPLRATPTFPHTSRPTPAAAPTAGGSPAALLSWALHSRTRALSAAPSPSPALGRELALVPQRPVLCNPGQATSRLWSARSLSGRKCLWEDQRRHLHAEPHLVYLDTCALRDVKSSGSQCKLIQTQPGTVGVAD